MANPEVHIDKEGNVTVDGKTITSSEVTAGLSTVDKAWREISNKRNWTLKNIERITVYVATFVTTSNVFGQIPLPASVRSGVLVAAGIALAGIHISTPKPTG